MAINKTINKRTNTHGAMRNCIEYVLRQDKTNELFTCVTGPYCHDEINYDLVYRTFLAEKKVWDKDSGRMYAHNIISWHKDEQITLEQAIEFGKEFAENWFSGFQTLVAVHKDKDHIHCHLVTNSVSYEDGRKLHNTRKDLERMKQLTNQMCRERGLTVTEKGKHFDGSQIEKGEVVAWSKDKYNLFRQQVKDSFVADCAMEVLKALENCISKEKFIEKMKQFGWNVNWTEKRKHITFQNQDGKKYVTVICQKHSILISARRVWRMNLIEITKGYEPKQNEQTEQMKSLPDITDKWKQLAKEQAASLELVTEERDKLQVKNQKMNEFILEFQERTHKLKMEKQNLFFENHEMQDEIRKLNDEIHHLTTELSETQKLNQSLQKNNDDLRNRNGLKSRGEQELLEEEIKDVRDQNSKLQIQVNKSSVEAVDEAQKKQKEAEKKARTIEYQFNKAQEEVKTVKKKTDCEIKKLKNEAKEKETFWMIAYMILVLLAVIKNTVFQKDLFACITVPLRFWYRYIEWLIHPSELNILGEREYFSAGWSWFLRIMAILIFLGLGISSEIFVLRKIEQYRKAWDKYFIWILLISVSSIAVIGDVVRKYFPINLILLLGLINIAAMEIKIYCHNKRELH